ncbi:MAG: EthD family reductase [bacterium]
MVTLTAFFKTPENIEAFEEHYSNVHSPLMQKVPGLRKMEVTRFTKMLTPATSLIGEQPYMQCTMFFDDKDGFKAAMASDENKAAGADLMSFAGSLVSMVIGSVENINL